ncbi:MAG TPA: DNA repair protein RecO [Clostridiales bacterium]|nr:DNA repair protein RecO [Clostridiales bacterium]
MKIALKGLVLRETKYKEADKILTVLTSDRGCISLRARGVLRKNSRIAPGCQLFTYTEFTVFSAAGIAMVDEADPMEMFLGLRQDLKKLALAAYIADVLCQLSDEDSANGALLRLALNSFYALSALSHPAELVRGAFEFRAMVESGFAPDLSACSVCHNEPEGALLHLTSGVLTCLSCRRSTPEMNAGIALPCSPEVLALLRYFAGAPLSRLLSVSYDPKVLPDLVGVTESYMATQMEKSFATLDYYKSL